ncbi:NADH:flavin oxidoreductase/NADH oxidase (plasmid) [Novosphingobium aromaticivorans DSM 12444]|uniref:NADH:flavin oxidoreductase/NADH oxidase n=1 Tax=Novosphingobium aromaticivorans (strain ATCC 700278 / DSM 12444 / CCUG 56034 / CIP 105152 / NBRC 16084 / F199) TaxID=279238 RepID=A4XEW5_NOVAD|nr:FAD-dependent oxidoreductase [Novosphingobium aromaticivorans]ABP64476.1 NADH:flavin oxidoreductase/NADH oxidase [Novosphingobium aromaticivorans DSM 12444]SCY93178.1 2,4-dienoyl-CoA reductase [Novosphingobium aromaticivorans]
MSSNLYPHLLSPGRIGTLEVKNRIAVTAMGVSLSEDDGTVGERIIAYHEEQARGGAGLIISGVAGVAWPVGAVAMQQTAISDDRFIPGLRKLTDRVHAHGAKIATQLHHGGFVAGYSHARWGHPLWGPAVPPAAKGNFTDYFLMEELAGLAGMKMPELKILEQEDIDVAVQQFAQGARRAKEAGFDGIEIHGGHGYLLSSFTSPYTNTRTDKYGGSLENRLRLTLEVIAAIRAEVGRDYPVWIKLDSREVGKPGGITLDMAKEAAKLVEAAGVDAITITSYHDTSVGKLHSESNIPHLENWNLPATAEIRKVVSIPVIGSGRIEVDSAESAIAKGETDFVAMGRKLLADPHLPRKLTEGATEKVRPCVYCYTCVSAIYMGQPTRCAVNAGLGNEFEGEPPMAGANPRRVAVIGGGPGGMESARRLAALGHKVTLIEKSDRLGGTLRFASLAYEPNERILEWLRREVKEAGIDVRLSTVATPDLLRSIGADAVIVATGAIRDMPPIPGNDQDHVYSGDDMRRMMLGESSEELKRKTGLFTRIATKVGAATGATANLALVRKATHAWMPLADTVTIVGGELVGLELAEFLSERGRTVNVVEEAPRMGKGLTLVRRMRLMAELAEHGVGLHAGASDIVIGKDSVSFTDASGARQTVPAGNVVVAKGAHGDLSLAEALRAAGFEVHAIGDANGVGYIEGAMHGARGAVRAVAGAA